MVGYLQKNTYHIPTYTNKTGSQPYFTEHKIPVPMTWGGGHPIHSLSKSGIFFSTFSMEFFFSHLYLSKRGKKNQHFFLWNFFFQRRKKKFQHFFMHCFFFYTCGKKNPTFFLIIFFFFFIFSPIFFFLLSSVPPLCL